MPTMSEMREIKVYLEGAAHQLQKAEEAARRCGMEEYLHSAGDNDPGIILLRGWVVDLIEIVGEDA